MTTSPSNQATVGRIKALVCQKFGLTVSQLESKTRKWNIVWPRFLAMRLIRDHTTLNKTEVGILFGNQNPSSVCHALAVVDNDTSNNARAARDLRTLKEAMAQ